MKNFMSTSTLGALLKQHKHLFASFKGLKCIPGSGNGGVQTVSPLLMALRRAKAEGRLDHLMVEDAEKDNQASLSFLGGDNQTNGHIMSYSAATTRNGTDLRASSTGANSMHSR